MYCSELNEQGQVTFLCSLITFVSTTFLAFSLSSSPVPPSPTLSFFEEVWIFHWPVRTELFSIPLLLFFFYGQFACIDRASEQGQCKYLSAATPVLSVCFRPCIHAFDLNQLSILPSVLSSCFCQRKGLVLARTGTKLCEGLSAPYSIWCQRGS